MHGDIRPENILCSFSVLGHCVVKLCNLNRMRRAGETCSAADISTEPHLAPEVYAAAQTGDMLKASLAMDMFALGLVLAQVLLPTAQPVLKFATEEARSAWYADETMRCAHLPVPAPYDTTVQGLMRTDPLQRTDAHALWRQIKEASGNASPK
jgi:serine/threonine protein kinase